MPLKTPDITTAQIVAYIAAALSAAIVLFKLNISDAQQAAALALIGALVPLGHMIADAITRNGRAKVAAAILTPTPTTDQTLPLELIADASHHPTPAQIDEQKALDRLGDSTSGTI